MRGVNVIPGSPLKAKGNEEQSCSLECGPSENDGVNDWGCLLGILSELCPCPIPKGMTSLGCFAAGKDHTVTVTHSLSCLTSYFCGSKSVVHQPVLSGLQPRVCWMLLQLLPLHLSLQLEEPSNIHLKASAVFPEKCSGKIYGRSLWSLKPSFLFFDENWRGEEKNMYIKQDYTANESSLPFCMHC